MCQKYLLHILIIKFILQNAMDFKLRILSTFSLVLLAIFTTPTEVLAQAILPVSRGGTGVGSFTAGSLFFFNGSTFEENNSKLFWDNTNNRLGIGTSAPTVPLEVLGNAKISGNLDVTGNVTATNLVPYTGATANVDLGIHNLTADRLASTNDAIINSVTVGLGGGSVFSNTAVGYEALISADPTSSGNTAVGFRALRNARYTGSNTAVGYDALGGTSGGGENTAVGVSSLKNNTTGSYNSAFGVTTLTNNTTGSANTALGWESLAFNNGDGNTVIGFRSLKENTTGNYNTVMGREAGWRQANGTSLSSPENSIYIGAFSKGYNDDDDNSIVIGYQTTGAGANKAVIGNSQVTDVYFGSSAGLAKIHAANVATITSGTSAPTSTPTALGQIYIDTNDTKVYISTGTSSSADWKLVN